jgi:hypothetical protein
MARSRLPNPIAPFLYLSTFLYTVPMSFEDPTKNNDSEGKQEIMQGERIALLPEKSLVTIEEIEARFGEDEPIVVCDFYLDKVESRGEEEPYGLKYKNILNLDHHAPVKRFERPVSSATLAVDYVREFGVFDKGSVAVNHTDCDSTLSSAIIRGVLPPDQKFSDAAIAADHTGEANDIGDLLQALQDKRDLDFSLRNLNLMLEGKEIDAEAKLLLEKRFADRERAQQFVESGAFQMIGNVAYADTDTKFDGAFLPALLPDATVILLGSPLRDKDGNPQEGLREVKIRLGKNVPEGMTLQTLKLAETPIHFGGRWNAGSNKRSGGTMLSLQECAEIVKAKLDQQA